ncbi:MAG: hypothetical protein WAL98_22010 [Desulfatiglandaceae bacterium]
MENFLKIVTECIDKFSKDTNIARHAAIIGGHAIILHGIPRTTLDVDVLLHYADTKEHPSEIVEKFVAFLKEQLEDLFEVEYFAASRDPFDPLKHDLIIITDPKKRFKKLDILIANYEWELEGLMSMASSDEGLLGSYPKPYLVGMKLMAGGAQDEEDIRNLFFIMTDVEKEKALEIAQLIKRDKNLSKILAKKRPGKMKGPQVDIQSRGSGEVGK